MTALKKKLIPSASGISQNPISDIINQRESHTPPTKAFYSDKQQETPEFYFRLIETADTKLEVVLAAKSIKTGLKQGETILLVSPEAPKDLIRKFALIGMDVKTLVKSKKLVLFGLRPEIVGNLSLATNYKEVFDELITLADRPVDRIIILKMDLLLNLESQHLAYASVHKFSQAADEIECKFIAQYSRNSSNAHDRLDAACSSLVNSYFEMKHGNQQSGHYHLQVKNTAI